MIEDTPAPPGAQPDELGAVARRERLKSVYLTARQCTACPQLPAARTQVVFGGGNADADLMLIGEAPGAREDEQGVPFVGASGKLLDELLTDAGLVRADVFITNIVKCRPPGNRDPTPGEIERCRPFLEEQIALVRPRVIATLGNFATRLLRGEPDAITETHGRAEVRTVGGRAVRLIPLFHPAAALYTRALLDTLRDDFAGIPGLLALPDLPQPERAVASDADVALTAAPVAEPGNAPMAPDPIITPTPEPEAPAPGQLDLFD
ncbi:MAG: uracil-DNA glycosylase [Solirubrobacteraceae bacterium]|nr:uracil-DNA glycosylase [Solirubrobacteraceae bacterium]